MVTPLAYLIGEPGDPIECKVITPGQLEIHWYPTWTPGEKCMCGKKTRERNADDDE